MSEAEFYEMVNRHDLTHDYSDDPSVFRAGHASLLRIHEAAKQLPRERAVAIWNECVDLKLVPEARASFYWRVEASTERAA